MAEGLPDFERCARELFYGQANVRKMLIQNREQIENFLAQFVANQANFTLLLGLLSTTPDRECVMFVTLELLTKEYLVSSKRGSNNSSHTSDSKEGL